MKIIEMGRALTENEVMGVKQAYDYLGGLCDFAMIGENVFFVLDTVDVSKDPERACLEAKAGMKSILSSHPDFSTHLMKDDHVLILMDFAGAFDREAMKEDSDNSKVCLAHSLILRSELLEACERGEVLALVSVTQ